MTNADVHPGASTSAEEGELVRQALQVLGIQNLVLAIHDASFPADSRDDIGRGSAGSFGGRDFLRFARDLGFTGIQLGPGGQTGPSNPSPYDGSVFGKNMLSLAAGPLSQSLPDLLPGETLTRLLVPRPPHARDHVDYEFAWKTAELLWSAIDDADRALGAGSALDPIRREFLARNGRAGDWLERALTFESLTVIHGTEDWHRWPNADQNLYGRPPGRDHEADRRAAEVRSLQPEVCRRYVLAQAVLAHQYAERQADARGLGLRLFADLQTGLAQRDVYCWRHLVWSEYLMGAPPSRTNPAGQPWGYPVIDPDQMWAGDDPAAGAAFVAARVDNALVDCAGLRIDHPHGLVYPWVYQAHAANPQEAVRMGARLNAAPDLPDHPALAQYTIVGPAQVNRSVERYADEWVSDLTPDQVARFGRLLALVMTHAHAAGCGTAHIACEVLSTWPRPLRAVMGQLGLGRFVVTQKTDPDDPTDVYRSECAQPRDWIMPGSHDTAPVWRLLQDWMQSGWISRRARHLADRFEVDPQRRSAMATILSQDPLHFVEAMFAELFMGPSAHVSIFFADLLGLSELYNRVGVVDRENWTLRVPHDYRSSYAERRHQRRAAHLPRSLALALEARIGNGSVNREQATPLLAKLRQISNTAE